MRKIYLATLLILLFSFDSLGQSYHPLSSGSYLQNWSNTGLLTTNDDWSGIPNIQGFLGQNLTTATGTNPQTILTGSSALSNDLDLIANQTNPNISNGGVAEFEITDPVVALQGSGTADAPFIVLYMNSSGLSGIRVRYNLRDIDASADNSIQPVALQYRIGNTGNFTDVPAGFVADATTGPSIASLVTAVDVFLPAACNNQPELEIRIITSNAVGNDEWVGIDDIDISGSAVPVNTVSVAAGTDASEPSANGSFTIDFSSPTPAPTDINFDFTSGTASFGTDYTVSYSSGSPSSATATGTLTVPAGISSVSITITPTDDAFIEGNETISLILSDPGGGYTLGTATASINLADNDVPPGVSVAAGTNADEPATNGTFDITLSEPAPAGGITINYTLGGTATLNSDYSDPQGGILSIAEGNSSGIITLNTIDDPDAEPVETISILLTNVTAPYVINTSSAIINLTSEDFSPISLVTTYSQDFNSLAIAGTTNPLAIQGWLLNETGGGARDNELHAADNGGSNTGDTYSYGAPASTERALGALQSGTLISSFGSAYINNTGTALTRIRVTYTGEQWRLGATGRNDRLDFQYSTDATNLVTGTWTDVDQLDFIAPNSTGTTGAVVGNDAANRLTVSYDIIGLSIPDGASFLIRWNDFNASGADDGLAIDDFSIEANPLDLTPPAITTFSPANGTTSVSLNSIAGLVFDEPVQSVAGNIVVRQTSDNSIVRSIAINSADVTVSSASVSFKLFGLAANTGYYIEIDNGALEDLSGNDFAGISGNSSWSFTTGTDFYSASFNSCTSSLTDGFSQYSITGDIVWTCTPFGRDPAAPAGTTPFPNGVQMNGFSGGTNVPNVDWLISPSLDLTGTTYPLLSFWSRTAFNGLPLQLKVSVNYTGGDPALATWTDLNGKFPPQTSNIWTLSADINLTAFKQPNVHFAFIYTSSDDDGARWTLDDVSIINSATPPPPSLTIGTTDIQFNYVAGGATADKVFQFTGNDLIDNVSLNSTGEFLLSKDGSSFSTSLMYTVAEANNITQTVYVRFAPVQNNQNFTGTIGISTSDLAGLINLKGTSIDPATTLEVVNWNIEWFGSTLEGPTNDAQQEQNVKTILETTGADIYGFVEIIDEAKLASVVSQLPGGYSYVISNYGSHTNTAANPPGALAQAQKMAFVYKTSIFSNVTTAPLLSVGINTAADLSNPNYNYWASGRFPFMMSADVTLNCVTRHMKFILVHAKANTSPTNVSYERRKNGADALYAELNANYSNDHIVILGDFNDDLDQSITAGFTTTSWNIFTEDAANYAPLTLPLSLAGKKSTVSYNDVIDHVVVSNELASYYMNETASILSDVTSLVSNYGSTTSDHYPVFTRYTFSNTTAPTVVSCPVVSPFCTSSSNTYTIPVFEATDDCDPVSYSYIITGATERNGNTNNASGTFLPGTSIINWTATDSWGNSITCQTTVVVNETPAVIIPDALAIASGAVANTVYIGYAPASSITLTTTVSGGTIPYSYNWTSGATTASATVSPVSNTDYTVTVTDANGCTATASKSIAVRDIRGKGNKVIICHKPQTQANTLEVSPSMVAGHLAHGDMLGACAGDEYPKFIVTATPNPSWHHFTATIRGGNPAQPVRLRVLDIFGRTVELRPNLQTNQSVAFGGNYRRGLYFAEFSHGNERLILPLLKL